MQALERILKILLLFFMVSVFLTTVAGSIVQAFQKGPWTVGDWLINYRGGLVRRGLLGEVIYWFSKSSFLSPAFFVIACQTFFYGIFFYYSYLLLKTQQSLVPFLFLIFSPFLFLFQIVGPGGGYRKEIIFFALFSFLAYSFRCKPEKFKTRFLASLCLYPALGFSHELISLLIFYPLALLFIEKRYLNFNPVEKLLISLSLFLNFAVFVFSILFPGDEGAQQKIIASLRSLGYIPGQPGAIDFLAVSFSNHWKTLNLDFYKSNYYLYGIYLVLICLAFYPLKERILALLKNKRALNLVLTNFFIFIPVFIFSVDWGRWFYVHAVALFILSSLINPTKEELKQVDLRIKKFLVGFLAILIYSQAWRLEHYAPKQIFVSRLNIARFKDPFQQIFKRSKKDFINLLVKK